VPAGTRYGAAAMTSLISVRKPNEIVAANAAAFFPGRLNRILDDVLNDMSDQVLNHDRPSLLRSLSEHIYDLTENLFPSFLSI